MSQGRERKESRFKLGGKNHYLKIFYAIRLLLLFTTLVRVYDIMVVMKLFLFLNATVFAPLPSGRITFGIDLHTRLCTCPSFTSTWSRKSIFPFILIRQRKWQDKRMQEIFKRDKLSLCVACSGAVLASLFIGVSWYGPV